MTDVPVSPGARRIRRLLDTRDDSYGVPLSALAGLREDGGLEFKACLEFDARRYACPAGGRGTNGDTIATVVRAAYALANTGGGAIVIGIAELAGTGLARAALQRCGRTFAPGTRAGCGCAAYAPVLDDGLAIPESKSRVVGLAAELEARGADVEFGDWANHITQRWLDPLWRGVCLTTFAPPAGCPVGGTWIVQRRETYDVLNPASAPAPVTVHALRVEDRTLAVLLVQPSPSVVIVRKERDGVAATGAWIRGSGECPRSTWVPLEDLDPHVNPVRLARAQRELRAGKRRDDVEDILTDLAAAALETHGPTRVQMRMQALRARDPALFQAVYAAMDVALQRNAASAAEPKELVAARARMGELRRALDGAAEGPSPRLERARLRAQVERLRAVAGSINEGDDGSGRRR